MDVRGPRVPVRRLEHLAAFHLRFRGLIDGVVAYVQTVQIIERADGPTLTTGMSPLFRQRQRKLARFSDRRISGSVIVRCGRPAEWNCGHSNRHVQPGHNLVGNGSVTMEARREPADQVGMCLDIDRPLRGVPSVGGPHSNAGPPGRWTPKRQSSTVRPAGAAGCRPGHRRSSLTDSKTGSPRNHVLRTRALWILSTGTSKRFWSITMKSADFPTVRLPVSLSIPMACGPFSV